MIAVTGERLPEALEEAVETALVPPRIGNGSAGSPAGTILLSHATEGSILDAQDSAAAFPAFAVGERRRQATCSDVAWIGQTHLAAVNLYGRHLRIYRLHEKAGIPQRLELIHETPGLAPPEGVAVSRDGSLLAVSHSFSVDHGLSIHAIDPATFRPGPPTLLRRGLASGAVHGVSFSPDGRHLACTVIGSAPSVEVMRLDGRVLTCCIDRFDPPLSPKSIAFSADGRFVLIALGLNAGPADNSSPRGGMLAVYRFDAQDGTICPEPSASYRAPERQLAFVDMSVFLPHVDNGIYRVLAADQGADRVQAFLFDPGHGTLKPDGTFADNLPFPHGIDASADGRYVAITTYGDDRIHIAHGGGAPAPRKLWHARPRVAVRRIAVIAHAAGPVIAGAERSYVDVVASIDRNRFHVTCVLPNDDPAYRARIAGFADQIVAFPYGWRSVVPCDPREVERFAAVLRANRIDLVHVNTITLLAPLLAAQRLGIPSILHARELIDQDEHFAEALGGPPGKIEHTLKAQADFIIANSEVTHRLFGKPQRSLRLYNCIDLQRFDRPNVLANGTLKVGIVGTVSPRKGTGDFVALAELARERRPELEFHIIGARNAEFDEIERRVCAGLGNLHLTDYVAESADAIGRLNVVMSLSVVPESFGRTIAEGMAMRRPVIAYDVGAACELIRHGRDGFLIPHRDYRAALAALETLAMAPQTVLDMGHSARMRAEELFAPDAFARALNGFYDHAFDAFERARVAAPATLARSALQPGLQAQA